MTTLTNYCKGELMSVCTAPADEQESCVYYDKSKTEDRCMYLKFSEYCDCLGAQIDAPAPVKEKEEEKNESAD